MPRQSPKIDAVIPEQHGHAVNDSKKQIFVKWLVSGTVKHLDFSPGSTEMLTTSEVGKVIGYNQDYVRNLIEEGRIEAHNGGTGTRPSWRVRRRSVVLYLAETAKYDPAEFFERVLSLLQCLTQGQLAFLTSEAAKLIQKP